MNLQNVFNLGTIRVMTIEIAVQTMLVGMPSPRDLRRVVTEHHAGPDADEHLAVDLDAAQVPW